VPKKPIAGVIKCIYALLSILVYLEYLFEESDAEDVPEFRNLDSPEANEMITRITGRLHGHLNL
jgi:hypothetical protein